jgi:hypothetical protein
VNQIKGADRSKNLPGLEAEREVAFEARKASDQCRGSFGGDEAAAVWWSGAEAEAEEEDEPEPRRVRLHGLVVTPCKLCLARDELCLARDEC